nr:hypothetical protein CFP56_56999 [Quercus suber]
MQREMVSCVSPAIGRRDLDSHMPQTDPDVAYATDESGRSPGSETQALYSRLSHGHPDSYFLLPTHSSFHANANPAVVVFGSDRPQEVGERLQSDVDHPETVRVTVTGSEDEHYIGARIARLQQALLSPALATLGATTIGVEFRDSHDLLNFLRWCLQREQWRWLGFSPDSEEDLVDVLEELGGPPATDAEHSLALDLLSLLLDHYRMQGSLPNDAGIENSPSSSRQVQGRVETRNGASYHSDSSSDSLNTLGSMMMCGENSHPSEVAMDTTMHEQEGMETALGLSTSAWTGDLFEHSGLLAPRRIGVRCFDVPIRVCRGCRKAFGMSRRAMAIPRGYLCFRRKEAPGLSAWKRFSLRFVHPDRMRSHITYIGVRNLPLPMTLVTLGRRGASLSTRHNSESTSSSLETIVTALLSSDIAVFSFHMLRYRTSL